MELSSISDPWQNHPHKPSHSENPPHNHGNKQPTTMINLATSKPPLERLMEPNNPLHRSTQPHWNPSHKPPTAPSQPWHWSTTPTAQIDPLTAPNHTENHHTSHQWNAFLLLDLGLDVINGVKAFHLQGVRKERWKKV